MLHRIQFFAVFILGLYTFNATAMPPLIEGMVFDDQNNNGIFDASERGVPNVLVSNGESIVKTDSKGHWILSPSQSPIIFVIKPDGWLVPKTTNGLPDFWLDVHSEKAHQGIAFALQKVKPLKKTETRLASTLDMLIFGDPQPKNIQDVAYYEKDIVKPLIGKTNADLGISLGDIVHGNLSLYPALNKVTQQLNTPWLHISGNHDRDYAANSDEQSLTSFSQQFGPDTFAWEEAGVSVIGLDNVIHEPNSGTPARYVGGLRESQFEFLKQYLRSLPKTRRIIVAMHIPLFDTDVKQERDTFRNADRQRLFELLKDFENVVMLTAHTHMQQHFFHDAIHGWKGSKPLHEYNVGTACGAFWSGIKDASGIPDTTMQDGTPNGYARLSWQESQTPKLNWQVARAPSQKQMQLFAPKVLRQKAYPGFAVYANVFMGASKTPVEYRIDGGEWKRMLRVDSLDPTLLEMNLKDARAEKLPAYDLTPEAQVSSHLWRGSLPTDLALGEHRIEVRAQLNEQWFSDGLSYRLQQAEP
jgi:C terminal of Calcineurin-like phosphoesterase/N terminal of Calcineurin-like phosphoesterase/Calcineurin-like phosphoesterase